MSTGFESAVNRPPFFQSSRPPVGTLDRIADLVGKTLFDVLTLALGI
jgi:hypothetical protein